MSLFPEANGPVIFAIETSCDETAVAVLAGNRLLASEIASQAQIHSAFGGVVPEVASRNHLVALPPLLQSAIAKTKISLREIDAFAAAAGPGLASSLMVGTSCAKGLAIGFGKPFLAVNHMEGHLLSPFFGNPNGIEPSVGLIVSGGHTMLLDVVRGGAYRLLGQTRDDAAGEAFDKVAKLLGLPYPGGPMIDLHAKNGDPARFDFPRSMRHSGDFQFSFSGLKTSVRYLIPKQAPEDLDDICASVQEAIVDILVEKTLAAAAATGRRIVGVSGGVSCNSRLRSKMSAACAEAGLDLRLASPALCTDNAAMIAFAASHQLRRGEITALDLDIDPAWKISCGTLP